MLTKILEAIGIFLMFFGMCMEECNDAAFVIQIVLVVCGTLILFIGYTKEKLKYERRQMDKRVEKIKNRKRE